MSDFFFSYENRRTPPRRYTPTDEFISVGHFKKEYLEKCLAENLIARRCNENMIPDYVLFENDEIPLDEQLKIIDALDHSCIRSITYSGGKSYHVLFKINAPDDITNDEYKKIWEDVMKYYNLYDLADKSNTNVSRLTRNPNGYRRKYIQNEKHEIIRVENTRIKQVCIFDNPNCDSIDISSDLETIRQEVALNKAWEEERRKKSDNIFKKLAMSPEEVLSRVKKECEAKVGYDMWQADNFPSGYNYLGCARGMYNICMQAGCDETETIEFCRQFLIAVSEAHPTNISRHKAAEWKPPITYR